MTASCGCFRDCSFWYFVVGFTSQTQRLLLECYTYKSLYVLTLKVSYMIHMWGNILLIMLLCFHFQFSTALAAGYFMSRFLMLQWAH